jgi:hypothetical protein
VEKKQRKITDGVKEFKKLTKGRELLFVLVLEEK